MICETVNQPKYSIFKKVPNFFLIFRSSYLSCPARKAVFRNFAKLTGKHWCFPVNFAKILWAPFLQNISGGCFLVLYSKIPVSSCYCRYLVCVNLEAGFQRCSRRITVKRILEDFQEKPEVGSYFNKAAEWGLINLLI